MSALAAPVLGFVFANTPPPDFDPNTVTPGPEGFLAIILVAVAVILLGIDMVRRIRRTTYREQIRERLAAEVAARDAAAGTLPDQTVPQRDQPDQPEPPRP